MFYTSLGWFNGFNPDSWVMYLMYALIVVFISAEAIFYLVKSVKKAKKIGMELAPLCHHHHTHLQPLSDTRCRSSFKFFVCGILDIFRHAAQSYRPSLSSMAL